MSGPDHDPRVPRAVLIGAGALIVASIVLAAVGRQSREAAAATAPEPTGVAVTLRFEDREDGAVVVRRADSGEEVSIVEPETGGFVRGVLRGMNRIRRLSSIDMTEPYVLMREDSGRLVLSCPHTGNEVELRSFGHTNYEAFASMLDAALESREG